MFDFAKSYAIVKGRVVDVLSYNAYIYSKKFSTYPSVV